MEWHFTDLIFQLHHFYQLHFWNLGAASVLKYINLLFTTTLSLILTICLFVCLSALYPRCFYLHQESRTHSGKCGPCSSHPSFCLSFTNCLICSWLRICHLLWSSLFPLLLWVLWLVPSCSLGFISCSYLCYIQRDTELCEPAFLEHLKFVPLFPLVCIFLL